MSIVSTILAVIIIVTVVITALFIIGLILVIKGIKKKRDPQNKRKKQPVAYIAAGILLLIMTVNSFIGLWVSLVFSLSQAV